MAYLIFYIYHFLSFFFFRNMDSVWHNLNQTVYLSYISSIYRLRFSVNFETKSVLFRESRWAKAAPCYHTFRPHCLLFNTRRIPSLNSKRGGGVPFFEEAWKHSAQSEPNLVETCTVSRLSFPSIYRLLRGRFSLNSKRKAFFFFFFEVARESTDSGWHSLISRPPSKAAPCYRCTGTMHFLPRVVPLFSNGSSSSRFYLSSSFFLPPSLPLLFDPSHYGSFCARMNAAVHRRFHDNGTGHSERHKY